MELKNGYSIGEAAKALDIPASTIRYYEKPVGSTGISL